MMIRKKSFPVTFQLNFSTSTVYCWLSTDIKQFMCILLGVNISAIYYSELHDRSVYLYSFATLLKLCAYSEIKIDWETRNAYIILVGKPHGKL
jgi:hypothetical protein